MNDSAEGVTGTQLSNFMSGKGYKWSNEAQVYYHYTYELPVYSNRQAELLYTIENR